MNIHINEKIKELQRLKEGLYFSSGFLTNEWWCEFETAKAKFGSGRHSDFEKAFEQAYSETKDMLTILDEEVRFIWDIKTRDEDGFFISHAYRGFIPAWKMSIYEKKRYLTENPNQYYSFWFSNKEWVFNCPKILLKQNDGNVYFYIEHIRKST